MIDKHNRTKVIYYREASFLNKSSHTLQELVEAAIKKLPLATQRFRLLNETAINEREPSERELINSHMNRYSMFFGNLIRYEDGANKHTVTLDTNAGELNVEQLAPPKTKDGKRREFLDSIMYFAIYKNHLVVLQTAALKTKDLERHLEWLLRSTELIGNEQGISLVQQLTDDAKKRIEKAPVKSLKIGTPLAGNSEAQETRSDVKLIPNSPMAERITTETKRVKITDAIPSLKILEYLGLDFSTLKEKFEEGTNQNTNIEVTVEISYKNKAKGQSQELMNSITKALRNSDLEDYVVEFKDSGQLKGGELILTAKLSIRYVDGLVDAEDFYLKVRDWLAQKIKEGVLSA